MVELHASTREESKECKALMHGTMNSLDIEPLCKVMLQQEFEFKLPNIGKRKDRTNNSYDHMDTKRTNDFMCQASMTLEKGTGNWYNNLLSGSVGLLHQTTPDKS